MIHEISEGEDHGMFGIIDDISSEVLVFVIAIGITERLDESSEFALDVVT